MRYCELGNDPPNAETKSKSEASSLSWDINASLSALRVEEKNTIASFFFNLSSNWCGKGQSLYSELLAFEEPGTVDGFFQNVYTHFPTKKDMQSYKAVFSRESLLHSYADGINRLEQEHPYYAEAEKVIWLRTVAIMRENPLTHEVEGLLYALDIDQEKNMQSIISKLLYCEYEFLCLIDAANGQLSIYGDPAANELLEFKRYHGCSYDDMLSIVLNELLREDFVAEGLGALRRETIVSRLSKQEYYVCRFPGKPDKDRERFIQWKFTYLDETKTRILMMRSDISDMISNERDTLTGLCSRQGFYRRTREELENHEDKEYKIIRFDLDNFKMINDTRGARHGDELLRQIGMLLRERCCEHSISARLEADHFVALLSEESADAETLFNELQTWLTEYPSDFKLTVHMGVYSVKDKELDVSVMCDRALLALKSIKGSYSKRVSYYDEAMRLRLMEEQELTGEMASALANGQFEVFFQPQVNYDGGAIIGAEALVRWRHPRRGLLTPGAFVPLFERNGLITYLDEYIWEQCCVYMRRWMDLGKRDFSISANISRIDIYNPHLCEKLCFLLRKYQLPASMLKLEITESAYVENPEQLIHSVKELRNAGFAIEMDDFGSGYSSLNTLKDVPVDILKLDMRFLSVCEDNERGGNILSSVIRMAHWLKLPVIAEGVETKTQADYLKSLNCYYMQGYHFWKPMPADEFEKLLLQSNTAAPDRYDDMDLEGFAAFWDPSAQMTLLFNSYVGGAAILEYQGDNIEILRANDTFYAQIETTREAYMDKQTHTLARFTPESAQKYLSMIKEAIRTGSEQECNIQSLPQCEGGRSFWTHNRVRLLAKNAESYLLYIAVENITERIEMEEELHISKEALQLSISHTGRTACYYDVPTRTLTLPEAYAQKHGTPTVLEDIPYRSLTVIPGDREKYIAFYEAIMRGEKTGTAIIRDCIADGCSYVWERLEFVTIFSERGEPVRALITVKDITAYVERDIESIRMQMLLERNGIGTFEYDVTTDLLRFQRFVKDEGVVTLTRKNYSKEILRDERIHPDFRQSLHLLLNRLCVREEKDGTIEYVTDVFGDEWRYARMYYTVVASEDGAVYSVLGQIEDIQREKDNDALIKKLNQALREQRTPIAYNMTVVERIFSQIYGGETTEQTVRGMLSFLGENYALNHIYIFETDPETEKPSISLEWRAAEETEPETEDTREQIIKVLEQKEFGGDFDANGCYLCEDTSGTKNPMAQALQKNGVSSFFLCAIADKDQYSGFFGFERKRKDRLWKKEEVGTLTIVSRIIGAFLLKLRQAERASFSSDFMAALEDHSAFTYIIDPSTFTIVYNNKKVREYEGSDYVGDRCYEQFMEKSEPCEDCPACALWKTGVSSATHVRRPDGLQLISQASPIRWHGRELTLISCTDVSAFLQWMGQAKSR